MNDRRLALLACTIGAIGGLCLVVYGILGLVGL
jgi:hypothetical protein